MSPSENDLVNFTHSLLEQKHMQAILKHMQANITAILCLPSTSTVFRHL